MPRSLPNSKNQVKEHITLLSYCLTLHAMSYQIILFLGLTYKSNFGIAWLDKMTHAKCAYSEASAICTLCVRHRLDSDIYCPKLEVGNFDDARKVRI